MSGSEVRNSKNASRRGAPSRAAASTTPVTESSSSFSAAVLLLTIAALLFAISFLQQGAAQGSGGFVENGGVVLIFMVVAGAVGMNLWRKELNRSIAEAISTSSENVSLQVAETLVALSPAAGTSGNSEAPGADPGAVEETAHHISKAAGKAPPFERPNASGRDRLSAGVERVTEMVRTGKGMENLDQSLAQAAATCFGATSACVFSVDEERAEFVITASFGAASSAWKEQSVSLGEGAPGLAVARQRAILLKHSEDLSLAVESGGESPAKGVAIPLVRGESLLGVLVLGTREDGNSWNEDDLLLLGNFVSVAVAAHEARETKSRLEKGLEEVLLLLATAVEERDPYAKGHTNRVARYAVEMAKGLRLDDETIRMVRWGALLHDIGKIGLPDHLLKKEGEYSEEEMELVRQHPMIAEKMIRRAESLAMACPMVRSHNERCDGSGYPDGLQGSEIPLTTHILIVANVFDAMTSDRSFRRALSVPEALEKLQASSGTKYDRRAVRAIVGLDEKLLQVSSGKTEGAVVRGQGTSSICIRD